MLIDTFEPLLGPVVVPPAFMPDWVITGGETDQGGHKARPSHHDWFRDLRDQAAAAGVPYHHKQNGEWIPLTQYGGGEWPSDSGGCCRLTYSGHKADGGFPMQKVGKKFAGRLLDGVEHNDFPEVA